MINGTVDEALIFKYQADIIAGLKGWASEWCSEASEEGVRKQECTVKRLNYLSGPTTAFLIHGMSDPETDVCDLTQYKLDNKNC